MALILQVFYSVFSGLLLTLGIPNELFLLGSPFFAFISIIPYYIAIKNAQNYKQAFLLGFIQTITTHLCSSFWLAFFKDFAIFTLGASALATGCIGGIMALFMYLPFSRTDRHPLTKNALIRPFFDDSAFRILYFSGLYTLYEWVKSSGFIGYPWGTISSAMYRWHSFTQLAAITGTYGITFLTVMFDCIVVEAAENYLKKQSLFSTLNAAKAFALLFGITLLWGNYEYNKPRTPDKTLTTIMVQQNFNPWNVVDDDEIIELSEAQSQKRINELKSLGKEPQLIVWSEGSLMGSFPNAYSSYKWTPESEPLLDFIRRNETPLLTGGIYRKKFTSENNPEEEPLIKYYNIAMLFDSQANFRGYYGKLHLVPFAESIPGIDNPVIRTIFKKVVGISAGWTQGEQLTYFELPCSYYDNPTTPRVNNIDISVPYEDTDSTQPLVRIATPVCFDDSFTDVMRPLFLNGAELFVNLTDDSWSLKKSSEFQHFCIASYRAIEYRTTLVRSTNAGYSVIVSPTGEILADQPLFEESSTAYDVPVYKRVITPYARFGNWLPYTCLVFFVLTSIRMFEQFLMYDYIPSERKKQLKLKKSDKSKKNKNHKHKK